MYVNPIIGTGQYLQEKFWDNEFRSSISRHVSEFVKISARLPTSQNVFSQIPNMFTHR